MRPKELVSIVWAAIQGLIERNGVEIAGHIAFTAMLSLFPFMIFLVSVAGFAGDTRTGQDFISTLSMFAPPTVMETLQPAIQQVIANRSESLLTVGLLLSLYSAASGVSAIRLALNLAYGLRETRSFWLIKLQDFFAVIVGSVVLMLSSVAIILGPEIWQLIAHFFFVDPQDQRLWHLGRYAFSLVAILGGVIALHRFLPNASFTLVQILPGALTTTIAWIVAASALTFYFAHIADYASTYGSLGGVIITLLFFYVSGIIFIFGGELNAALLSRHQTRRPDRQKEKQSFVSSSS
jgi:membrane protein